MNKCKQTYICTVKCTDLENCDYFKMSEKSSKCKYLIGIYCMNITAQEDARDNPDW